MILRSGSGDWRRHHSGHNLKVPFQQVLVTVFHKEPTCYP